MLASQAIEKHLNVNEELFYVTKVHRFVFALPAGLFDLACVMLLFNWLLFKTPMLNTIALIIFSFVIVFGVNALRIWKTSWFAVVREKAKVESGEKVSNYMLVRYKGKVVRLRNEDITDIKLKDSFISKIFMYGTIVVKGEKNYKFKFVENHNMFIANLIDFEIRPYYDTY